MTAPILPCVDENLEDPKLQLCPRSHGTQAVVTQMVPRTGLASICDIVRQMDIDDEEAMFFSPTTPVVCGSPYLAALSTQHGNVGISLFQRAQNTMYPIVIVVIMVPVMVPIMFPNP